MRNTRILSTLIIVLAFASISVYGQKSQDAMMPKEKWELVTIEGTVTEIAKETRDVTVIGPKGGLLTIEAGDAVRRFNEISVGDVITCDYWTYIMAEFREPTKEELAEPFVVLTEAERAPQSKDPAAMVGAVVKAVVTIEVLNRPLMMATVKGPQGNYLSIEMEDKTLIERLKVGQVVILTYGEAVALSLTKVKRD